MMSLNTFIFQLPKEYHYNSYYYKNFVIPNARYIIIGIVLHKVLSYWTPFFLPLLLTAETKFHCLLDPFVRTKCW